jgi:hypothetical protein
MTTATQVQLRRGSATDIAAFTGAAGEVVVDTTNSRAVVHDGATAGGFALARRAEKQRSIASSADLPITAHDVILNVNLSSPLTIPVPTAASQKAPLLFKMVTGSKAATFTFSDGADGQPSLSRDGGEKLAIAPYNDGVNTGWGIW